MFKYITQHVFIMRYGGAGPNVPRKREENTHVPFHMPNVVAKGRLRAHVLGGDDKKW